MIEQALAFQHSLGKKSAEAKTLDLPGNKLLLVKPSGESEIIDKGPALRNDRVASLASLVDWCGNNGIEEQLDVWVSDKLVLAVNGYNNPASTDKATLSLRESSAWATLLLWNGQGRKQKEAVRLLRGPLADTFDPQHLRVLKNLDFTRKSDGSRSVTHKGESLGRSVEAASQSRDGDIPEVIAFTVPRFDFEGSPTVFIKMAVEVDAEADTISLFVIGDAFVQGTRAALNEIKTDLDDMIEFANVYLS